MKRLFLASLLLISAASSQAQVSTIDSTRLWVAARYACSTFHCRTKDVEAVEADTLYGLLHRTAAAIVSSGSLDAACHIGNTTATSILISDSVDEQLQVSNTVSGASALLNPNLLQFKPNAYRVQISPVYPTANRALYLPDEPFMSSSAEARLMTHGTSQNTKWHNGGAAYTNIDINTIYLTDGAVTPQATSITGGDIQVANGVTGGQVEITGDAVTVNTPIAGSRPTVEVTSTSGGGGGEVHMLDAIGGPGSVYRDTLRITDAGLSAGHAQFYPNEGTAANVLASTFMLHQSKDPVTLYVSTDTLLLSADSIKGKTSSTYYRLTQAGGLAHNNATLTGNYSAGAITTANNSTGHFTQLRFPTSPTGSNHIDFLDLASTIPATSDYQRSTGLTGAYTGTAYTIGASDVTLEVSANVRVTTSTTFNFDVHVTYTDETGTSATITLFFTDGGGVFGHAIAQAEGAVPYCGSAFHVRAKAGTTVTFSTAGTFTSVVYNIETEIKQTK